MNKKLIILVVILSLLVAGLAAAYFATRPEPKTNDKPQATETTPKQEGTPNATNPEQTQPTKAGTPFTVEIVHKDGTKKTLELKSDKDFVGEVLDEQNLIEYDIGAYGKFIKAVDGEKAVYEEDSAYWAFYVNGEYAQFGVDQTPIEEGKVYKLEYTAA